MSALALLTGDAQTFLSKVWASRVHVHRADPDDLVGLLSLRDADSLLTSSAIRTPSIRLAKDGAVLPESAYTRGATLAGKPLTGLVDARKALALFDDGATIVFQGVHRYWPPLTQLIAELELELGHPCQANAYLTPTVPPAVELEGKLLPLHPVDPIHNAKRKRPALRAPAPQKPARPRVTFHPADTLLKAAKAKKGDLQ